MKFSNIFPRFGHGRDGSQDTLQSSKDTLQSSSKTTEFTFGEDENKERGNWTGKLDFLLACIGYAVGFGNVWRFPYLCYRNGGGAFLVPYTLMLAFAGLPLFFMELAFGQYASLGPISIWKISPFFKGIGYGMVCISGMVCIYYNVILAYVLFYFFSSFTSRVPWSSCDNPWNTPSCHSIQANGSVTSMYDMENTTVHLPRRTSPSEEYWERRVLEMSSGLDEPGKVVWHLALCLLLAWTIVFFCLVKGVKSTGKVVYFTATFPYIVLTILLIRGASLPGSLEGVKFYIVPSFKKLADARVWGDAAIQIFYSLGPGWGGLITMASYNRFHNNCYRDSIIVAVTNCGTSVFAGFVIFSVVGFMSHELGVPVANVSASGPGLAFVVYPEGLSRMPGAPFWSVMFFFMLITLGLDSMFAMLETVTSSFQDEFPDLLRSHKELFTLLCCIAGYLLGLPVVTQGGVYLMNLMDYYCGIFSLLIIALFELLVIMYIYGYKRFMKDIEMMIGFRPNMYWSVTWLAVTPAVVLFIIVFNSVFYQPVTYDGRAYPKSGETLGWFMVAFPLIWIPIFMVIKTCQHIASVQNLWWYVSLPWTGETLRRLVSPTVDWGPALKHHQQSESSSTHDLRRAEESDESIINTIYDNPGLDDSTAKAALYLYESHI